MIKYSYQRIKRSKLIEVFYRRSIAAQAHCAEQNEKNVKQTIVSVRIRNYCPIKPHMLMLTTGMYQFIQVIDRQHTTVIAAYIESRFTVFERIFICRLQQKSNDGI